MKRFIFGLMIVALLLATQINFVHATVNDFVIKDFQADYYLDKDNSGHSTLNTVENITAEFPEFDQNHGIERAVVSTYDGHTTSLQIQSVTDQNEKSLSYSTSWQNDNLVLRIGDKDTYVHGMQTYIIKYTQRDVTRFFADTNDDEFYWDTNGSGWYQVFDNLTARIHVGADIAGDLTGNNACYFGIAGSSQKCVITKSDNVLTANAKNLSPGENITVAIGFKPHTFTEYQMSFSDFITKYMAIISVVIGSVITIFIIVLRMTKGKSAPGRGTIIAEYLPPRDIDVAMSSVILNKMQTWAAAMYIDLAVRHNIRIVERETDAFSLEYIKIDKLTDTETTVIKALFGDNPKEGDRYDVDKSKTNSKLAFKLMSIYRQVKRTAKSQGYYIIDNKLRITMAILALIAAGQSFVFWILSSSGLSLYVESLPIIGIAFAAIGLTIVAMMKPLSAKGRELFDYLKGLEVYINTAEKDRIAVLQSPKGAEKTPVNTDDAGLMLHLYERVLPYAVLFGSEKEWVKTLGKYYEQQETSPDWYVGNSAFNAVMFSSAFSNFSDSVYSNNYIQSSSSSSGGSGGGGFSGGGGGGGGGGGW